MSDDFVWDTRSCSQRSNTAGGEGHRRLDCRSSVSRMASTLDTLLQPDLDIVMVLLEIKRWVDHFLSDQPTRKIFCPAGNTGARRVKVDKNAAYICT